MKKIFFLFLSLLANQEIIAQSNFPPIYEIQNDTIGLENLPSSCWQMLEDKDGKLSFEQVSNSPVADKFHYDTTEKINFQIPTYWFRFVLKNTANHQLKIGFYENFKATSDWYFREANGKLMHKTSGLETPWSDNEGLKFMSIFPSSVYFLPVAVEAGAVLVIYNRVHYDLFNYNSTNPRQFEIPFGSTDKAILQNYVLNESHYFNSVHDSFFFGVALLAAIFNFFSFLIIRERSYLYFALYLFFLGFGRFNIDSEFYLVFMREHPVAYSYLFDFFWTFTDFFLAFFIRSLLNTKKYYPRWDKFLHYLTLFNSALFISAYFIDYRFRGTNIWGIGHSIQSISTDILNISLVVTLVMFLRKPSFFDRRFLIAIIPSFVIWVGGLILFNTISDFPFWFHFQMPDFILWINNNWHLIETVCLFWQILCFSWLLFHRFIELKQQVVKNELEKEIERSQLIAQQKVELEKQVYIRTSELNQSLENLKSAQSQLIQSEKMASLGELTAGIAHEIQNPLNFVNNFSEVNTDLIDELQTELKSGNSGEALSISNNIRDNEQKINHHGKRADAIVKSMLQHSQLSVGKKELTDLNGIADEYLRLAYHGLRAKAKTFNVTLKTSYDKSIGKVSIVAQDMGRVLLNLYNNAFYAVEEKMKQHPGGYEPTVSISTTRLDGKVQISIHDNGNGIPLKVLDKIFQPFFTTKPTGQGTGLGLSLSYDIIKAHGGDIKVETKDGEGTEFVIQIQAV